MKRVLALITNVNEMSRIRDGYPDKDWSIVTAENVEQAREAARTSGPFDELIVGFDMKTMGLLDDMKALRNLGVTIPAIAIVSDGKEWSSMAQRMQDVGFTHVITRPVNAMEITALHKPVSAPTMPSTESIRQDQIAVRAPKRA